MSATSHLWKKASSFDPSGKVAVPRPPPRRLPFDPSMRPSSEQWVREVATLAQSADAAIGGVRETITHSTEVRKTISKQQAIEKLASDTAVEQKANETEAKLKRIRKALRTLEDEMVIALRLRDKAARKVQSLQKPMETMKRRLEARAVAIPQSENYHDVVERNLNFALADLQNAARDLEGAIAALEGAIAHMEGLRAVLHADAANKEMFKAVTLQCRSEREMARADDFTPCSTGGEGPLLPLLGNVSKRAPLVQRNDTEAAIAGASSAVAQSVSIRSKIHSAMKKADATVVASTAAVEASFMKKMQDTHALQKVLSERLGALRCELAALAAAKEQLIAEANDFVAPLPSLLGKAETRKAVAPRQEVKGLDAVKEATAGQLTVLRRGAAEHKKQLAKLEAHEKKLVELIKELEKAEHSKVELMTLDERILLIGNTPTAPSSRSHSSRSSKSSSRRSETSSVARGGK